MILPAFLKNITVLYKVTEYKNSEFHDYTSKGICHDE